MPAGSSISSGREPSSSAVTAERFTVPIGGTSLVGVLHLPTTAGGPFPAVIACHGLGASKDSDKYLLLGATLPTVGLALVRFDFRGAGESGGSYREATTAMRIDDLEAVLDFLAKHPALSNRMGLLGSSMGGYVAWHVAHRRIQAGGAPLPVVTWNAPADLTSLEAREMSEASGLGPALVAEVRNGRLAEAPVGVSHALVVQGERDEVVAPGHGRRLYERARDPRALHLIAAGDHRLTDMRHREEAVERSQGWMTRHLGA
jgi:dipeptidyl aminopeptidase/acylaminoacyl peptidase